ncbi:hypothetical protein Acr_19g0008950 [Actinidia rufa]|uniref:Uncharacterized protein n=1 Tax=Actinidia rufa TaxID=165716 RepID=A0A7J0GB82_9ERIC|nr:hypothetical protein Acr_19g0008950 [Actinidia rufa]
MAICLSPTSIFSLIHTTNSTASPNHFAHQNSLFTINLHRSSPFFGSNLKAWPDRCRAVSPGRPPPLPESEPPPNGNDPTPYEGTRTVHS